MVTYSFNGTMVCCAGRWISEELFVGVDRRLDVLLGLVIWLLWVAFWTLYRPVVSFPISSELGEWARLLIKRHPWIWFFNWSLRLVHPNDPAPSHPRWHTVPDYWTCLAADVEQIRVDWRSPLLFDQSVGQLAGWLSLLHSTLHCQTAPPCH